MSKLIGSEEDYKKVLSAAYTFNVYNPDTKRTEIKDLSAFLPDEFDISEEQKDYLKKVEEIKNQRQAYLENKGITSDILEQISKRKLPSVYDTEEKLDVRDTPQETTEQKTENEEQDQSFKEPYRKYYQTLSKQEKSLYEEDEQSPTHDNAPPLKEENPSVEKVYMPSEADKELTHITIPDGYTSIGEGAFRGFSNLKTVTIPESVKTIGRYAFMDCYNLQIANIPEGVTTIEIGTFAGCNNLESITIPESVTTVEAQAFHQCDNLR